MSQSEKKQIHSIQSIIEFRIQIKIQKQIYETLIDSNATENFISQIFINREGFSIRELEKNYLI